jgi:Xaa-Pro aminopeptidase
MALAPEVFAERRRRVLEAIGPGAALILPAAVEAIRSHDVEYRFRQHSDFHYLTGFPEPGAVCLLLPGHHDEYVLFVRPRDRERETWTGRRAGVDGAIADYGAIMAHPVEQLDAKMAEYLADRERWYYAIDRDDAFTQRVLGWWKQARTARPRSGTGPGALLDPRDLVHEMRLRKGAEELDCLRRAVAITAAAHAAAMRAARAGVHEHEIEALIEHTFRRAGAAGPAYPSIIASGPNATVLHYTTNTRCLRADDLVLIDAGAEVEGYCADVTRTFPVGPRLEGRGRAVYEIVLRAQLAAIAMIRPGVRIEEVHAQAVAIIVEGLLALGLLTGSAADVQAQELYKPFFMHRTSHWLGLDVHDAGLYKVAGASRVLEPGMVLTVEPGIYIADHLEDVGPAWHGLGVRIEDDVLVTADGHEVLTAGIPKQIDAIEALRREALGSAS